jgi:hypothetical protein
MIRQQGRGFCASHANLFYTQRVAGTSGSDRPNREVERMPLVDAIKACFVKYADFEGRASRSEYWWFFLAVLIGSTAAWLISPRLYGLFEVATLLPMLAMGARATA